MFGRFGRAAWVFGIVILTGTTDSTEARAAGWANALFQESSHDFGPVPRGAKVRHDFVLTNRLNEPLNIVNVRASCGCTSGRATTTVVDPGQSAAIEAEMDTRNFVGRKETVLFVSLISTSGREAEVRLGVGSTILSDVVLNPGMIDFGLVEKGQTPALDLTLDRVGMPTWRIHRIVSTCKAIDALLQETRREGQNVSYRLTVTLRADAPAGALRDEIRLLSNDPTTSVLPLRISAMIRGDLTASPNPLSLGQANSSGEVSGKILVRASRPFKVRGVEGEGAGFKIQADHEEARTVHLLTVTYHPETGGTLGDLRRTFRVHSDLPNEPPVELTTTVRVSP